MSASQRHKCEIHNRTVIYDGSCPPYNSVIYPPQSAVPEEPIPDRFYAYSDGIGYMSTPYVLDGTKNLVIGAVFYGEDTEPDYTRINTLFGVDTDFALVTSHINDNTQSVFRSLLAGQNNNRRDLGSTEGRTRLVISIAIPANSGLGDNATVRVDQRSDLAAIGPNGWPVGPLLFGFRSGGGTNKFKGLIADAFVIEDGVLVHQWPMDEGTGTSATDIIGGDDGTYIDMQWIEGADYNP